MKRKTAKTEQLQLRVTPFQKRAIRRQAERARLGMSQWILSRILPSAQVAFQGLVEELARSETPSYAFAELLDWLGPLDAVEFAAAVSEAPEVPLAPYWQNYLAATVEQAAAANHGTFVPFLELSHLKVFRATAEYMLAMKCLALRTGEGFRDEEDIRYLLRNLGIRRVGDAVAILERYYSLDSYPPPAIPVLRELLGDGAGPASASPTSA